MAYFCVFDLMHYRINKQQDMSFEFSSILSTVDLSKHLIMVWIIRKFIQLVNFVTFSVSYFFFGNRVWLNHRRPKREIRRNNFNYFLKCKINETYANVTLAFERCCVTKMRLQGFVWELHGFALNS